MYRISCGTPFGSNHCQVLCRCCKRTFGCASETSYCKFFLMNDDARDQLLQLPHLQQRHARRMKNALYQQMNRTFAVFVCFSSWYSSFLQLELVRYSTWRIYVSELALTIDLFKGNLGVQNLDTKTISFLMKHHSETT
jgi:hypothetical protein